MSSEDDENHDPREQCFPLPFAELMGLDTLDSRQQDAASPSEPERKYRFRSRATPFPPGEGAMAFGGHVYAQSAYAASKTVEKGLVIHNMTGTFTLPGRLGVPFIYTVRCTRDGKLYCTRTVDARQDGAICFSCVCSFKREEKGGQTFSHQPRPVQQRYKSILHGKRPEDHPVSPSVDAEWWVQHVRDGNITEREFPGVEMRKVDMKGCNSTEDVKRDPGKYRQLSLYSIKGSPEDQEPTRPKSIHNLKTKDQSGKYDNLYACAHMYASDKNSALIVPRALDDTNFIAIASLTFTVIFHQHGDALRMIDWQVAEQKPVPTGMENLPKKWFIQEAWTPRSGENRAVHESWLWSQDGTLLATTVQDCMLRYSSEEKL